VNKKHILALIILGVILFLVFYYKGVLQTIITYSSKYKINKMISPEKVINKISKVIEFNSHLITVRYRYSNFLCKKKKYKRLFGRWWEGEAKICWVVSADVIAGYRIADLKIKKQNNDIVIEAGQPRILGVDNREQQLVYAYVPERFELEERDIFSEINEQIKQEAEDQKILEGAKAGLLIIGRSLAQKYGLKIDVKFIDNTKDGGKSEEQKEF